MSAKCVALCGASKAYGRHDQPWKHAPECPVRVEWEAAGKPPTTTDLGSFPNSFLRADLNVDALPRRTAHAVHALMEVRNDLSAGPYGPYLAAEIILYDGESLSVRETAAALREGQKMGLALNVGNGLWTASNLALDNRGAFEARYLRDTDSESLATALPPSSESSQGEAGGRTASSSGGEPA